RHDHEADEQPHERPERAPGLDGLDDLSDEHRLHERRDRADDAEDRDDDQRASVFEQEGEQLAERGARAVGLRAAPAAAWCRRARHAGPRSERWAVSTVVRPGVRLGKDDWAAATARRLLAAVLAVRGLLRHAEGARDRLPRVAGVAGAAHLRLL